MSTVAPLHISLFFLEIRIQAQGFCYLTYVIDYSICGPPAFSYVLIHIKQIQFYLMDRNQISTSTDLLELNESSENTPFLAVASCSIPS